MGTHPANLMLRFLLELGALLALGRWGWGRGTGSWRYLLAIGLPLLAATAWGVFAVPGDPSRSGSAPVPVPGAARLLLELAFFGLALGALYSAGHRVAAAVLGGLVVVHYVLSWDRLGWLLQR